MKRTIRTASEQQPIALTEWLARSFSDGDGITDDIHFDQLDGPWNVINDGFQCAAYAADVLAVASKALRIMPNLNEVRQACVVLPLRETKRIRLWTPETWQAAGMWYVPPSLLLLKKPQYPYRYDEEYFRRIESPVPCTVPAEVAYLSGRNFGGYDDHFSNLIFMRAIIDNSTDYVFWQS